MFLLTLLKLSGPVTVSSESKSCQHHKQATMVERHSNEDERRTTTRPRCPSRFTQENDERYEDKDNKKDGRQERPC